MTDLMLPPHNVEVEEALLGCCLRDPNAIAVVEDKIDSKAFYLPANQKIYEAILSIHQQGDPVDLTTVATRLASEKQLEDIGGMPRLAGLASVVSGTNADRYAAIIMDKYYRRRLQSVGRKIVDLGSDETTDFEELAGKAQQALLEVITKRDSDEHEHSLEELLTQLLDEIDSPGSIYSTGISGLDDFISGFAPGEVTVIAGRPSMGKTAFTLQLLLNFVRAYDHQALLYELEMTGRSLSQRLISLASIEMGEVPLPYQRFRQHMKGPETGIVFGQNELDVITKATGWLLDFAPITINEKGGITVEEIMASARRRAAESQVGLIIVDFIGLMGKETASSNRSRELANIVTRLRNFVKNDLPNCHLIVVSQINRGVEARQDKRPTLSDLSESGGIEQLADSVLFLYRPGYYTDDADDRDLQLIVAKNRGGGPTGTVDLTTLLEYNHISGTRRGQNDY